MMYHFVLLRANYVLGAWGEGWTVSYNEWNPSESLSGKFDLKMFFNHRGRRTKQSMEKTLIDESIRVLWPHQKECYNFYYHSNAVASQAEPKSWAQKKIKIFKLKNMSWICKHQRFLPVRGYVHPFIALLPPTCGLSTPILCLFQIHFQVNTFEQLFIMFSSHSCGGAAHKRQVNFHDRLLFEYLKLSMLFLVSAIGVLPCFGGA